MQPSFEVKQVKNLERLNGIIYLAVSLACIHTLRNDIGIEFEAFMAMCVQMVVFWLGRSWRWYFHPGKQAYIE